MLHIQCCLCLLLGFPQFLYFLVILCYILGDDLWSLLWLLLWLSCCLYLVCCDGSLVRCQLVLFPVYVSVLLFVISSFSCSFFFLGFSLIYVFLSILDCCLRFHCHCLSHRWTILLFVSFISFYFSLSVVFPLFCFLWCCFLWIFLWVLLSSLSNFLVGSSGSLPASVWYVRLARISIFLIFTWKNIVWSQEDLVQTQDWKLTIYCHYVLLHCFKERSL